VLDGVARRAPEVTGRALRMLLRGCARQNFANVVRQPPQDSVDIQRIVTPAELRLLLPQHRSVVAKPKVTLDRQSRWLAVESEAWQLSS
jgi:hypothetical protein